MKLELNGWYLGLNFSACHFLPEHDKCCRLHGHNYGVHLALEGDVGESGIVFDFVVLKKTVRTVLNELDHKVLLPGNSKVLNLDVGKENVSVKNGGKHYSFPLEDVAILDLSSVSAEMLARFILHRLLSELKLGSNISQIEVRVDEGIGQGARACQRL